jgi:histidyl-tRNA synthetase
MKKADASGARLALILGEDELAAGEVTVKPLRAARPQQRVARGGLPCRLAEFLKDD